MSPLWALLTAVLALGLLVLVVVWRGRAATRTSEASRYDDTERRHMPPEIAAGRLVLSETLMRTRRPAPLVAKVDQGFLVPGVGVVLVETKTRYRRQVWAYDVLELSVQRTVVANARPDLGPVADYGYVRVVAPGRAPVYLRTRLVDHDAVARLRQRRLSLLQGTAEPRLPPDTRVCINCGQRKGCRFAA